MLPVVPEDLVVSAMEMVFALFTIAAAILSCLFMPR